MGRALAKKFREFNVEDCLGSEGPGKATARAIAQAVGKSNDEGIRR
jgi:hypothetical protein